jgi:hypothetical protein
VVRLGRGRVYTQNFTDYPDTLQIDKLLQIAEKLQAHVQGDGGETYPLRDDEPSTMASEASPSYAPSRLGLLVAFVEVNTLLVAVAAWAYRNAPRAQKVPVWFEAYAFYAIFTCVVAVSWAFFGKPLFRRWVSLPGHWLWYGQKGLDLSGLIAAPALLACIVGKLFGLF